MNTYQSAVDYLVAEQGVSREVVKGLEDRGFRHATMICPDIFERVAYERMLNQQFNPKDIKIISLRGGGRAYWVRTGEMMVKKVLGKEEL